MTGSQSQPHSSQNVSVSTSDGHLRQNSIDVHRNLKEKYEQIQAQGPDSNGIDGETSTILERIQALEEDPQVQTMFRTEGKHARPTEDEEAGPQLKRARWNDAEATSSKPTAAQTAPAPAINPVLASPSAPSTTMTASLSSNPYSAYLNNPYAFWYPPPLMYVPQLPPPQPSVKSQEVNHPIQHRGRPKRLKAHTVTTKNFNIPLVPRDGGGKPMLPLNVGIMTVISLGEVCLREHFHTERYIFPVGFEVRRRYLSTQDKATEVVYHCTILDGGDGPKFQIIPSDAPDLAVIAGTATGAWSNIVRKANALRNRQHSNSVSGPDFFGLGQNTIKHLLQQLPNADKLRDYVWQNFVEGGPLGGRHAAVVPALPEDYDGTFRFGTHQPGDKRKRPTQVVDSEGNLSTEETSIPIDPQLTGEVPRLISTVGTSDSPGEGVAETIASIIVSGGTPA